MGSQLRKDCRVLYRKPSLSTTVLSFAKHPSGGKAIDDPVGLLRAESRSEIDVAERTVSRLIPERRTPPSQTWRTFLTNQSGPPTWPPKSSDRADVRSSNGLRPHQYRPHVAARRPPHEPRVHRHLAPVASPTPPN